LVIITFSEGTSTCLSCSHVYWQNSLALPNCIGGRVGRGIQTLAGIHGPTDAVLCWFLENNLSQHFHIYTSPKQHVDLFNLFGDAWETVIWFQCLSVEEEQLGAIRILAPDEPQ
jgi:hypothetical protein